MTNDRGIPEATVVQSAEPPPPVAASKLRSSRTAIFIYDLALLAILLMIGAVRLAKIITLPSDPYALAIESMWFGALGGVIISLKGVYDHADSAKGWDRSFDLWHIGRPFSGAIAGMMTVVLLSAVNTNSHHLTRPVVYAAAFIFGTQERRFFHFLYEVARLIVQVPEEVKNKGLRLTDILPAEGPPGRLVLVTGQGLTPDVKLKLGAAVAEKLTVSADGTSAAAVIPQRPLGADVVDVVIVDSTGVSFTLPTKFKFTA